jgi:glycosyltransferase involved in cell wall biosynthesis
MKIVHVIASIDPAGGGPPQVAVRLAAAQAQLGHEVHVLTYAQADLASEERTAQQVATVPYVRSLRIHKLPPPRLSERLFARKAEESFVDILPASDCVHLHGIWERVLHRAAAAARRMEIRYCIRPAGMLNPWSLAQKRWKKRLALTLEVRRVLNGAQFIHCLNTEESAFIEALNLKPPLLVFPNGVFLEEIEPLPPGGKFFLAHPSLNGRRFVLFLGRLHYVKGLEYLADAWAQCAESIPDVDLVVAGPDGGAKRDFEARICRAGLSHRVHIVGPLYGAEKYAALVDAACFCLPSKQEGFSVAVVEALACGVPVVMSDACRFPEAASAGAAQVVPLEATSLAGALRGVLTNEQQAQAMGRAGRALIRRSYTWPVIADRIVEAYRAVR